MPDPAPRDRRLAFTARRFTPALIVRRWRPREGMAVTVQTCTQVVDLGDVQGLAGLAGDSIDQMILMRAERMTLQPVKLIVAECCQYSIALPIGNGNILHAGHTSR